MTTFVPESRSNGVQAPRQTCASYARRSVVRGRADISQPACTSMYPYAAPMPLY